MPQSDPHLSPSIDDVLWPCSCHSWKAMDRWDVNKPEAASCFSLIPLYNTISCLCLSRCRWPPVSCFAILCTTSTAYRLHWSLHDATYATVGTSLRVCWVEGRLAFACTYHCHSGMRVGVVENVSRHVLEDLRKQDAQNESFKTGVCSMLFLLLLLSSKPRQLRLIGFKVARYPSQSGNGPGLEAYRSPRILC